MGNNKIRKSKVHGCKKQLLIKSENIKKYSTFLSIRLGPMDFG